MPRSISQPASRNKGEGASTDPGRSSSGTFWNSEIRLRITTALLSILLCAAAGFFALQQSGGAIVTLSYDLPFLAHRAGGAADVRAVFLDEVVDGTLDRSIQAPLLDKLREAGARAVVYDIIFDREWPDPTVDDAFAEAIQRFRGVDAKGIPIQGASRGFVILACGREKLEHTGFTGERLIPPTDVLLAAAGDEFGLVTLSHVDYVVRELATGTRDEESIAWKAAVALGSDLDGAERLKSRWINYAGPPPHPDDPNSAPAIPSFPARAVLADVNPAMFRDKIVIIGGKPGIVSPNLGEDLFSTPFHRLDFRGKLPYMSGVEVQANILVNLLQKNWLNRSGRTTDLLFIIVIAVIAGIGFSRVRPFFGFLFTFVGIIVLAIAGVLSVHFGGFWFPWSVAAFVQLPLGLVSGTAAHFYIERFFRVKLTGEQEQLRDAFERYVSPQMLGRIIDENFHLKLGGDLVEASMMFTDIENFTDMCENIGDPEVIVENLNGYFERTTGDVFDHGGVVIKFIGDAIFAAWGVPFADKDAAVKSVRAAWKLFEHARFLVAGDELRTRVGIHFGEVMAGNVGSSRHIDYTLIGDAVNLAARLESLNKTLGTSILLSHSVYSHLNGEFVTRRVGQFKVKGRKDATEVYELLGPTAKCVVPDWMKVYNTALAAFESEEYAEASELFAKCDAARMAGDGPSRFFIKLLDGEHTTVGGMVDLKEK